MRQPDAPSNVQPESECAEIARHAIALIAAEKGKSDDEAAMMTNIVEARCTADHWTAVSKTCMANAVQRRDVMNCIEGLTGEQQDALRRDEKNRLPKLVHQSEPGAPASP